MTIRGVFEGWQRYSQVLYTEDRQLFEKNVSDLNVDALEGLGLGKNPFELIAMALALQQQEMIAWLLKAIQEREGQLG